MVNYKMRAPKIKTIYTG